MSEQVKVLQKGKITIPANIRQKLGINEGDCVTLKIMGNRVVILPPNTVPNPTELLTGLGEGIEIKEPLKQELIKASASRVTKKMLRSK
jgi:AbrB family looped-hinge helix DNA binding protein